MKRNLAEILYPENENDGYAPGDQDAHRAAMALGDRLDLPSIVALTDAFSFLDRVGGQLVVTTIRQKVDREGRPVGKDEPGEYRTFGFSLDYESRDASVVVVAPPTQVFNLPVQDTSEPATEIMLEPEQPAPAPADPEGETDLRDDIEREADALAEDAEPVNSPTA